MNNEKKPVIRSIPFISPEKDTCPFCGKALETVKTYCVVEINYFDQIQSMLLLYCSICQICYCNDASLREQKTIEGKRGRMLPFKVSTFDVSDLTREEVVSRMLRRRKIEKETVDARAKVIQSSVVPNITIESIGTINREISDCPICRTSLTTRIVPCRLEVDGKKRVVQKSLFYCTNCMIYIATPSKISRITRGTPKSFNNRKQILTKVGANTFNIEGLDKNVIRELSYSQLSRSELLKVVNNSNKNNIRNNNSFLNEERNSDNKKQKLITGIDYFVVPFAINHCPKCRNKLWPDYVVKYRASDKSVQKINGSYCDHCKALYVSHDEKKKVNKFGIVVREDYNEQFDVRAADKLFYNHKSIFQQFFLMHSGKYRIISITSIEAHEDKTKDIYYYCTPVGFNLISAEKSGSLDVEILGDSYLILNKRKKHLSNHLQKEINSCCPILSTDKTIYIYQRCTSCHRNHRIIDFSASIKSIDSKHYFYVEYCVQCRKFMMNFDDYQSHLRRYGFFPISVRKDYLGIGYQNRATESPLYSLGYNVSEYHNLSSRKRHSILAYIVDNGVMSRRDVLFYLDMFIRDSCNRADRANAVAKWKEDKEFLLSYNLSTLPKVQVVELKAKNPTTLGYSR